MKKNREYAEYLESERKVIEELERRKRLDNYIDGQTL
jgi:hypothetical protein